MKLDIPGNVKILFNWTNGTNRIVELDKLINIIIMIRIKYYNIINKYFLFKFNHKLLTFWTILNHFLGNDFISLGSLCPSKFLYDEYILASKYLIFSRKVNKEKTVSISLLSTLKKTIVKVLNICFFGKSTIHVMKNMTYIRNFLLKNK